VGSQDSTDGGQQLLLGKKLLERGLITADQLREALVERARMVAGGDTKGAPLGGILVSKGFLTDAQLSDAMADGTPPPPASPTPAPASRPGSSTGSVSLPATARSVPQDPATTRLGKYSLVRELGRGGMGVVYEAVDTQLDRKVALKLLLVNPNLEPKDLQLEQDRFVQEAQLSAKLKHPNIVTIYEAGILDGRQFLAMELVEGRPFSDWRGSVNFRDQVGVLRDVAHAVHHAHEQGILHRDLKPRNILVAVGNRPFVTDFGLAKSMGKGAGLSLTGSGAVVGTPAYMSPEQAQGLDRIDWRTDIYSLGVILYEMMAGRPPFQGESPIEILMKVVKDPVVPPLQVAEGAAVLGLDRAIENICLKALAKKDRDRYVTAQAFAEDLTKWLQGAEVQTAVPKAAAARKKGVKVRLFPIVAATFVALLAGAAGAYFFLGGFSGLTGKLPVEENLVKAREFMEQGDFQQAIIYFRVAAGFDAGNAEAKAGEAEAVRRMRDKAEKEKRREEDLSRSAEKKWTESEQLARQAKEKADAAEVARSDSERTKLLAERSDLLEKARLRRQDAEREYAMLKKAPPVGTAIPETGTEAGWERATPLLPLVDLARGVVWGTWSWQDEKLLSDRARNARVEVPYDAPEEYDLRTVFTRTSGSDAVAVIFTAQGRALSWEMGSAGNSASGFRTGADSFLPVAADVLRGLVNDRPYALVLQVRREGVKASLDGKEVGSLPADRVGFAALSPGWKLRGPGAFGIGSHGSPTTFQRFDLREITGKGRRQEPSAGLVLRSTPVGFGTLKPGVIGEYYYGKDFESLAIRRHEVGLSFVWGEGTGWVGGPTDAFSCRWKGYLQIARPARYTFQLRCDDGARLFIDDIQIIGGWSARPDAPRRAVVQLQEGFHRIVVEHFEEGYQAMMDLSWAEGTDVQPVPISPRVLFYNPAELQPFQATAPQESAGVLKAHSNSVTGLAWRPDGKALASSGEDRRVKLWNVSSRKQEGVDTMHPSGVLSISLGQEGKLFASGAWDSKVRFWLAGGSGEINVLEGHTAFVQSVAFSPDGKKLASGSYDRTLRVWDVDAAATAQVLSGHAGGVECVAWSPDGKLLASASLDHTVRLWDAESGEPRGVLTGHADFVESAAFSPDGKLLASAGWDGLVKLWDVASAREVGTLEGHTGEALVVAFSPDGKLLASGGSDAMIRLWHPGTRSALRVLPGHTGRVMSLAFSKDGRYLASGSFDATVRLWDVGTK
jgi:WD40 repeat protein/RIO-like serine/threonine protein kinase